MYVRFVECRTLAAVVLAPQGTIQSSMTKNEKNKNKNWVISPFTVPTLHRGRGLRIIGVNDRPTRILHEFRQSLLEFCIRKGGVGGSPR
jgi:hypothetical protein